MPDVLPDLPSRESAHGGDATTHWSVVLAAGRKTSVEADGALEKLCRPYWRPLYTYVAAAASSKKAHRI